MDVRDERELHDPLTGRLLDGRYLIGPRIASGGMASVYEATDTRLDRAVAVKVMHPGMGDDGEFAARFVREARHAARLSHPNVVGVFDQGDEHGTVYLAMEYVPGHTLRDVIRKEAPMAPARALAFLEPVLSALRAAHSAGVIHRDVKPENVLIADDGRIKVADFGLARAVSADTQHTATAGVLIGTVSYLAPELVVDGRADARADVYAAGVLLYELLTGRKPHEGESPIQVAYKHVHEDVPAPSASVPGLPGYVDALVARATARDRGLRPADAGVLLHQVHRVAQALREGVTDDPELVADLAPPVLPTYDTEELGDVSPTTSLDLRPTPAPPATLPATPPTTMAVPAGPTADRRRPAYNRRRGPILLLVALLVAALTGVGAWWFGFARYTTTPGVIELTAAQAEQRVEAAGLAFEVAGEEFSENVPAGSVISTDPAAGDRILDGGTVEAVVSKGLERYDVPKLRGLTEDRAQARIAAVNLSFGRSIPRYHDSVEAGRVIASDPKAGASLKRDSAVNLVLSRGPRPIEVRDWTGRNAERAERALSGKGLEVATSEEFSDSVPEGRVISQTPRSGQLFKGDTVELVVSKGPELVAIPRVRAMGVGAATARLEELGFEVETEESRGYLGLGYVYAVSPGEGEQVPKGSTVTLILV